MASDSKHKNRQSTITFTLPLSCQICLGKVKQPVLCPNHHVFCQLCMNIWLEKNKQCPTCRVEISDENPVKNIIGGQLEDEDVRKQSSADLRRARFELLYKEYEDQFDQMRKESIILRTENNILLAQLQDFEDNKSSELNNSEKDKMASSSKNEPNLLMLTKNLQEAQTLYIGIKEEMTQLKHENSKLKDENVNLTRDNENLRLEIAQRSPKKFGRYTVATLETKLSEYEKEIRQLKKALERSDEYIEDLERKIEKLSHSGQDQVQQHSNKMKNGSVSKEILHHEMNGHAFVNGRDESPLDSTDKDKETYSSLFKQAHDISQDHESAKRMLFPGSISIRDDKIQQNNSKSELEKGCSNNNIGTQNGKQPGSIMKHGEKSHKQYNCDISNVHEKLSKSKKVHFNVPKSVNTSLSFELEMPSPCGSGAQSISQPEESDKSKDRSDSHNVLESLDEVDGDLSSWSDFDRHVVSLLKKANASNYDQSSGLKLSSNGSKNEGSHYSNLKNNHYEEGNDSSRLSIPDFDSPRKPPSLDSNGLSDMSREPRLSHRDELEFDDGDKRKNDSIRDTTELDISMTPEMSDCLRLMNQAERKLERAPTSVLNSERGMSPTLSSRSNLVSFPLTSNSNSRAFPVANNSLINPRPLTQSLSMSESMRGWEQDFFRGLHANPYKPYRFTDPHSSHGTVSSDNKNDLHDTHLDKSVPSSLHNISSFNSTNARTSSLYYSTSNPKPFSSASANIGGTSLNPLSLHHDKPLSVTGSIPISVSSSGHANTVVGSNHHPFPASIPPQSSSDLRLSSYSLTKSSSSNSMPFSKDLYHYHASSSHSIGREGRRSNRSPLPLSLNNNSSLELEWPESPGKNLISSEPGDLDSSCDVMPRSSSSRQHDDNRVISAGTNSSRNLPNHGQGYIPGTFSSDVQKSSFLSVSEPKKRLFTIDDDLDLSMPSKSPKK